MMTFKDVWEETLDNLEIKSANLLVWFLYFFTKFNTKFYLSFKKNLQIAFLKGTT